MTNGPGRRLRGCAPLLLAAAPAVSALPAGAVTLPPRPVTEVHLVKAQHEGLRFHWQAVVSEEGGAFFLRRRGERGAAGLVRVASRGQRAYDAQWPAPAGSGVYELRYRDARGVEHLVATMLVNCHTLDRGCPSERASPPRQPVVAPEFELAGLAPLAWRDPEPAAWPAQPEREPSTPPPRWSSAVA